MKMGRCVFASLAVFASLLMHGGRAEEVKPPPATRFFEGGLLLAAPTGVCTDSGLHPFDVLKCVNGQLPVSLSALRVRLKECLGQTIDTLVRRDGVELHVKWTVQPGTYSLDEWPSPGEWFERIHAGKEDPDLAAGRAAMKALQEESVRSALRNLDKISMKDPILAWARAWILIRFQSAPQASEAILADAFDQCSKSPAAIQEHLRGLCLQAQGFLHLARGKPQDALLSYRASRQAGVDGVALARAIAPTLGANNGDGQTAQGLLEEAFQDDPLNLEQAQLLARVTKDEAKRAAYEKQAAQLAGGAKLDPRIRLAKLVAAAPSGPQAALEAVKFVEANAGMDAAARADALDAAAAVLEADKETALNVRAKAFLIDPRKGRADALAEATRRFGLYAPALRSLRAFYETHELQLSNLRPYMLLWVDLNREAYLKDGVAVLEEALRLKDAGKLKEGIALLEEKAERLALPELLVTAGLWLRESGQLKDPDTYWAKEYQFFYDLCWGDASTWIYCYGCCLLQVRTEYPHGIHMPNGPWLIKQDAQNAVFWAVRAAMEAKGRDRDTAKGYLQKAVALLENKRHEKVWVPIYAEGRLCRTLKDYIDALKETEKLDLPEPVPIKPPAPPDEDF